MKSAPQDTETKEARELAARFGATVRRLRQERQISQENFADLCGVHRTSMSVIERGLHMVSLFTAAKIAKALNLRLVDLMNEIDRTSEIGNLPSKGPKPRTGPRSFK